MTRQCNKAANLHITLSFIEFPTSLLLWKFTFSPKTSSKHLRTHFKSTTFWRDSSPMNNVSSMNWNRETPTGFSLPTIKGENRLRCTTSLIKPLRRSTPIRKRKEATFSHTEKFYGAAIDMERNPRGFQAALNLWCSFVVELYPPQHIQTKLPLHQVS